MTDRFIVRTTNAGVFFGEIESRHENTVIMRNVRRIWYWDGAASLSQLAMEGTKRPENCKFPCSMDSVQLFEVIEIITTTLEAQKSIDSVKVWEC